MSWGLRPRPPDFIIGDDGQGGYLRRWFILPRNPWLNVYLHEVRRDDDDRALHDHPWWNCSIVLAGGYWEVTPGPADDRPARRWRGPGSLVFRPATAAHRLEVGLRPAWTLFITGPRIREWGFHCPQGWRRWQDFVAPYDAGQVGPGCGDPPTGGVRAPPEYGVGERLPGRIGGQRKGDTS